MFSLKSIIRTLLRQQHIIGSKRALENRHSKIENRPSKIRVIVSGDDLSALGYDLILYQAVNEKDGFTLLLDLYHRNCLRCLSRLLNVFAGDIPVNCNPVLRLFMQSPLTIVQPMSQACVWISRMLFQMLMTYQLSLLLDSTLTPDIICLSLRLVT